MADGDNDNFERVFHLLDVLAIQVHDTKAIGERTEAKLDTHIVETRAGFERVDRRLGEIENRVESLEMHAARADQRLGEIETHAARSDKRLDGIETNVAHIDSTLLKLL